MKTIPKLFICLILVIGISFSLFSDSASAVFTDSCRDTNLNGPILSSSCKDRNGNYKYSSIGLNPFIGNRNGLLHWGGENFANSCEGIRLEGAGALFANCKKVNGDFNDTNINLDNRISNTDGNLTYYLP